jgi:hypothetical protein
MRPRATFGGRHPERGDRLGVVVEREPGVGVPEEGLRGLHIDAGGDQPGGVRPA